MSVIRKSNRWYFSLIIVFVLFLVVLDTAVAQISGERGSQITSSVIYGVLPADKKLFVYKVHQAKGEVDINIKNEALENIAFQSVQLPPDIVKLEVDIHGDKAFLLLGYGSSKNYLKTLLVFDLETAAYSSKPIPSNFAFPTVFKAFSSAVLMIGVLEEGDVLEVFNLEQEFLTTITDFFEPDTRVWDLKVVDDQVDILLMSGEKKRKKLQLLSFDNEGNRLLNIPIKFPENRKFFVRNAQILHGPYQEQKIIGIYSNKYGEWFSGYFHLEINEFLEQQLQLYPYKEMEGFYDYLSNNKRSRKPKKKNYNKEMILVDAVSEGELVTIVAQPLKTVRKFAHFISIDQQGEKVFDKSVKLYYDYRINASELQLTNQDTAVYFMFGGNQNRLNPPGKKIYEINKGESVQINQVHRLLADPSIFNYLPSPKFLHWYGNKFVIFGLTIPQGGRVNQPEFIIRKIEV
ncbi:hypothetical protein [Cecembia lonarensis]|uniref:Uncharacterized protein n=1 Tax=Cecembia lonarensis (strain CCUG 58316 / KCTC 22772 / LW9) TaxID=1225176 RepID=K1LVY7_CECL9|nr:hypothetical protein [Cecembia lonarensis]EKB48279.1 hypothetical protein B879_03095 [Cecembia lonarensis LW9]